VASGSVAPSQLDTDQAAFAGATADADALAAQIERKTVRAPFAGKLGIRLVNVGQYLGPGTPITVLESSEATYVDFDLPQQDLSRVAVGMPVRLTLGAGDAGAGPRTSSGAVFAIDPDVDPTTRNIRVRASVPRQDDWLRPGMFVDVAVVEPRKDDVVAIPATAVVHAPYGDSVFVIEGHDGALVARQQFVKLGHNRGDFVAVAEGLQPGQRVVSAGAFKLRNGSRVVIDNEVALHPELAPNPPNR
jgi:membrane fusion protein, multidrug efflux system